MTAEAGMDIRSGELISDRYRVIRLIGRGGMGAVYEAVDERLDVRVALKESYAEHAELRKQFEREARLLASLTHQSLPKVNDYFAERGQAFLVMEFIDGVSLAEVMANQEAPMPARQVVAWADQVLDVLMFLHGQDRSVVHRDIKPQNLRLTSAGRIVLLDFGLAKVSANDQDGVRSVHGYSRRYSPIEQIQNAGTNERSDIYALGATLYYLLTGRRPDDAEDRVRGRARTGFDCLPRADDVLPAIGEELAVIIERAMALSSAERFQTAAEFREALRQLGRSACAGDDKTAGIGESGDRYLNRRRGFALVAAVAITVAAISVARMWPAEVKDAQVQSSVTNDLGKAGGTAKSSGPRSKTSVREKPKAVQSPQTLPATNDAAKLPAKEPRRASITQVRQMRRPALNDPAPQSTSSVVKAERSVAKGNDDNSTEVMRAPDGTEVTRFKDGRLHVSDRGGTRQ